MILPLVFVALAPNPVGVRLDVYVEAGGTGRLGLETTDLVREGPTRLVAGRRRRVPAPIRLEAGSRGFFGRGLVTTEDARRAAIRVTAGEDDRVVIFDVPRRRVVRTLRVPRCQSVEFSPDGGSLFLSSQVGHFYDGLLLHLATGRRTSLVGVDRLIWASRGADLLVGRLVLKNVGTSRYSSRAAFTVYGFGAGGWRVTGTGEGAATGFLRRDPVLRHALGQGLFSLIEHLAERSPEDARLRRSLDAKAPPPVAGVDGRGFQYARDRFASADGSALGTPYTSPPNELPLFTWRTGHRYAHWSSPPIYYRFRAEGGWASSYLYTGVAGSHPRLLHADTVEGLQPGPVLLN